MPRKRVQSRILCVRLTEDEYRRCAQVCDSERLSSISAFVHRAMTRDLRRAATKVHPDLGLTCERIPRALDDLHRNLEVALGLIEERRTAQKTKPCSLHLEP